MWFIVSVYFGAGWFAHSFLHRDRTETFDNSHGFSQMGYTFRWGGWENFFFVENTRIIVRISVKVNTTADNFVSHLSGLNGHFGLIKLSVAGEPAAGEVTCPGWATSYNGIGWLWRLLIHTPPTHDADKLLNVSVVMTPDGIRLNDVPCTQNELPSKLNQFAAKYSHSLMLNFELAGEVQYGDFFKVLQQCQIPAFGNFRVSELRR
ncbi:MAG: hypothetical protein LBK60_02510 [Verrucomicrobiales bacterium]|nr:hypothetical protein [Verrucomicrobiales bacterium]